MGKLATFYEERMDELLAVAKSLEIKDLCNAETDSNDEPNDEPSPSDPTENLGEETVLSDLIIKQAPKKRRKKSCRYRKQTCVCTVSQDL